MGYRIARKHADRLCRIVQLAAPMAAGSSPMAAILSVFAALLQFLGMLVERWLFFAEAKHTVTLYYGR